MDMALKNLSNGAIALLLGVVTAAVAAVGIVMTIATTQMFGLTGRIDTLYTDSAGVKADVAKTAAATEYMKQDMAEMNVGHAAIHRQAARAGRHQRWRSGQLYAGQRPVHAR